MPDSPTADDISRDTRNGAIVELAVRLFPEDGHESDDENEAASVFSLLCDVTRTYTELISGSTNLSEVDYADTVQPLLENVAPSFKVAKND